MMHAMNNIEVLKKVASTCMSRNANSLSMTRGEQVTYLNQTLLAISNILDYGENKQDRLKLLLNEKKSVDESLCSHSERLESGYPSTIFQLYTQRLALQANAQQGFHSVSLQSSLDREDDPNQMSDHSVFLVLLEVLESINNLCHHDWKHLFEFRQQSKVDPGSKSDPFSTDCCFVDEQCLQLLMQQLDAVQERCKKLAEEEEKVRAAAKASREDEERRAENKDGDDRASFEECAWRIRERLAGYEECLDRLLDDLWDWTDDQGIRVLEENQQLLIEPRWVKKLMNLGLKFRREISRATNEDKIERHKRVLKLSSVCFAVLPLPLQSSLFQWLWHQPNGHTLFKDASVINVEQELTHVFNRLVTGSTDTQLTERAKEICSIALHCVSSTLQKVILEAVSNADAGKLICKVLQCIPFLVELQVDGATCFLTELSRYVGTLGMRELSSAEELNLFKFADAIIKSYQPPTYPEYPITCLPLVSPLHLADFCIWPFLGPASQNQTLRSDPRSGPGLPSHLPSGSVPLPKSVPKHVTLKLLDHVLRNNLSTANEQEQDALDISVCFSTILSLCHLLHDCILPDDGEAMYTFLIKEMTLDLLGRMSSYVIEVHADVLSTCLEWLVEETSAVDWTVRLTLHSLFSDVLPSCEKEVKSCIDEITSSLQPTQPITDSVPLYVVWSSSLVPLFQGSRISSKLSKQFVKSLSGTPIPVTSSSRIDFYQAVCLALVQVLPHSTTPEWLNFLETLDLMREEGLLHVSYTAHFMTNLPTCDITVCQRPLQLSQVFLSVIQLLSELSFSQGLIDDLWQHITKTYTQVIKKIQSDATVNISSNASNSTQASQIFLIGQFFCQSCEVSQRVSGTATEQLFVWSLELIMRIEEPLSCRGDDDAAADVISDVAYREMNTLRRAVEWLPSSEQRMTLQQKLSALFSR